MTIGPREGAGVTFALSGAIEQEKGPLARTRAGAVVGHRRMTSPGDREDDLYNPRPLRGDQGPRPGPQMCGIDSQNSQNSDPGPACGR